MSSYIDQLPTQPDLLKIRKIQGPAVPPSLASLKGEWECLTSRPVNCGDVLALYSGTVAHSLWGVKGEKISTKRVAIHENRLWLDPELGGGSLTQFINHGFPNCAFFRHLYHRVPIIAIIALDDMPANTTLYLSYGANYFNEMTPIIPNPEAIDAYLKDTNGLNNIPILECLSNGEGHIYRQKGKIGSKSIPGQVSLSDAVKGWSHKIRLEYLNNSQNQLGTKISRANGSWLKSYFA